MDIDEVKELKRNTEVTIFNLLCDLYNKTGMNISSLEFDTVQSRGLVQNSVVLFPASFKVNLSLN